VIALGEHHHPEYSISTPEAVLAGIATRTCRIHLSSGVTVLSSDDPVRVFQRFATVDALSNGRAEIILSRGSFTEPFPLFGYDLADYNTLFDEKIELFARLLKEKPVTWNGFIADTDEKAREVLAALSGFRDRIGALRGWPPVTREEYDHEIEHGSIYIGSPDTVARKIAHAVKGLGVDRFDLIYSGGCQPASARLRAVEL
jgi:alkanesulfonate monooxygenase SsuD/methylene tetrahydromethanopterin reductase-like flavin-dependent oxidoreductase (luciferase family)